jgi:hypothetical protein
MWWEEDEDWLEHKWWEQRPDWQEVQPRIVPLVEPSHGGVKSLRWWCQYHLLVSKRAARVGRSYEDLQHLWFVEEDPDERLRIIFQVFALQKAAEDGDQALMAKAARAAASSIQPYSGADASMPAVPMARSLGLRPKATSEFLRRRAFSQATCEGYVAPNLVTTTAATIPAGSWIPLIWNSAQLIHELQMCQRLNPSEILVNRCNINGDICQR